MRAILLTAAVWLLLGEEIVRCVAQNAAQDYISNLNTGRSEAMQRAGKLATDGREMFGIDAQRYGKPEYVGTLANKEPSAYTIGDWGCPERAFFRTIQQVSRNEYLVDACFEWNRDDARLFLLRGVDTSKARDDIEFMLHRPLLVKEPYEYTTIVGATKTILVLDADGERLDAYLSAMKQAAEDALYRQWSDAAGQFSVNAKLLVVKNSQAILERRDNHAKIEIPLIRLSKDDQKWVRNELKRRLDQKKPAKARQR